MILSGPLFQRNGFGFWFASSRKRLMAACRTTSEWKRRAAEPPLGQLGKEAPMTALFKTFSAANKVVLPFLL